MSSAPAGPEPWTQVIQPHGRLLDLRLRELWAYRDLVALLVYRDFVAQYKQTILGPAWHFVQPLLITLVFLLVFSRIARLPTDGLPPFLFYLAGTVLWSYFAGVLTRTSNTFVANAGILGKVYVPRLVLPVSVLLSQLIGFSIQFLLFLVVLGAYAASGAPVHPGAWILATPLLLLMIAALGLGAGILVAALTTRYRDLAVLVGFGVQLLMYASPIIYPLSAIPEPWRSWAALNPVAPIVEAFRLAFLGAGTVSAGSLAGSAAIITVLLLAGVVQFNRVERTFMDTV